MDSLSEYDEIIQEAVGASASGRLWFRGWAGDEESGLLPTLFRHPDIREPGPIRELEDRLVTRFQQRSMPYLAGGPLSDDWEYLFLMQHYGVPTRLLDWTENAYIALWFSLANDYPGDAVIWMLDPTRLNRHVFEHQSYERGVFSVGDLQLNGYAPRARLDDMNRSPVALYGTHNSPRIVAQRGVFTVAGKEVASLAHFIPDTRDDASMLRILHVGAAAKGTILEQLRAAGFAESMIFPDLEGLARELKSTEGF